VSVGFLIIAIAAILAVSTVFSMVGQGGGVLYVPILLALGTDFHEAATTSLFVIVATSGSAAIMYRSRRFVDWKLALAIEPPTFGMAFAGGLLAEYIGVLALKVIFAGVLIVASFFMLRPTEESHVEPGQGWGHWHRTTGDSDYIVGLPILMPATTAAGFVAGMIGVGGGLFKLPAMVLLGGVPLRIAIGTSALMVTATALAGFVGHIPGGYFQPWVALPLAVSAFAGGRIGSALSVGVEAGMLRRLFAGILLLASAWMIVNAIT
jgi:uncharacterized membrane protein YfcA